MATSQESYLSPSSAALFIVEMVIFGVLWAGSAVAGLELAEVLGFDGLVALFTLFAVPALVLALAHRGLNYAQDR